MILCKANPAIEKYSGGTLLQLYSNRQHYYPYIDRSYFDRPFYGGYGWPHIHVNIWGETP